MLPPAMAITAPAECTPAVPSSEGSAVDGPNHNVSGGIRGGEAENQSRLLAFNSAGHEDGSDEKERPAQSR